ncbi:hypothetical protein L3V86_00450 [Thiotrichales bacterium 19S11-10]|nr:hypothetical protein [Thiotrichales bacterium 19S11-10]
MKLSKYTNMISLIIISGFLSSCQNDISSDSSQPADSTYSLTESANGDTAIVSSDYDIDVNLLENPSSNSFSLGATSSQTENTQTASNTQLHFINSNASEFNVNYSNNCNNLNVDNSCDISVTPKDLNIDNQTIGYYVTSSVNGETIKTKPDYFIVKSLTLVNPPITGSDNSKAKLKVKNETGITVNVDPYNFLLNEGTTTVAKADSSTCHGDLASGESCIVQLTTPNLINTDKKNEKAQYIMQNKDNDIDAAISNVAIVTPVVKVSSSLSAIHSLQKTTFTIKNTSPVTARNLNITLPELNNVKLVSNTCGENLPGYDKCQVIYQAGTHPSGSSELTVSGDNFASTSTTIEASTPARLEVSVSPTHITTNSNVNKIVTLNVTNNSRYPVSDLQVTINSSIASSFHDTTDSTCNSDYSLKSNNSCKYVYKYKPGDIDEASYPDVSFEVTANNSSNSAKTTLTINNYPYFYDIPQNTQRVHNSLSNHTVNSVSVADNGKVYVATNAGLSTSTSDNLSSNQWQQFTTADTKLYSDIIGTTFIDSNGFIYISSYEDGISISYDNGLTWHKTAPIFIPHPKKHYIYSNAPWVSAIYVYVNNGSTTIYAGISKGIRFSTNKGKTWHACGDSPPKVNSIYVDSTGHIYITGWDNGLYISKEANNCNSGWDIIKTNSYENHNIASNNTTKVYIDNHDYIYLGTDKGLSYSTDAGKSWMTGLSGNTIKSIDTDSSNRVYIGTSSGLFVSDNALTDDSTLLTWQQYTNDDINSLTLDTNGMIYEGTNKNGLFVYKNINDLQPLSKAINDPDYTISSDDSSPINYPNDSLFIDQNQKIYVGTWGGGLYTSIDGGTTWQRTNADDTNGLNSNNINSVFVTEPDNIYLGTDNGLSIYNGESWSTITNGLASNYVQCVFVDDANIYAGTYYGLSISNDSGTSWTTSLKDAGYFGISAVFVDGNYIYAGTDKGLYISNDKGSSWTKVDSNTKGFASSNNIGSIYVHDHTVYVGTFGGGLSVSKDYGKTWKTYNVKNTKNNLNRIYSIFVDKYNRVYVATNYHRLFISNPEMTKWSHYSFRKGIGGVKSRSVFVDNQGTIFVSGSFYYASFISKMEVSD